jgi:chorismate mutase
VTSEDPQNALAQCRTGIDDVDRRIVELLNERTLIVEQIGSIKQSFKMPIYEPKREEDVYLNIRACNHGPMPPDSVKRIFERIIDEMRTIQRNRMLGEKQS